MCGILAGSEDYNDNDKIYVSVKFSTLRQILHNGNIFDIIIRCFARFFLNSFINVLIIIIPARRNLKRQRHSQSTYPSSSVIPPTRAALIIPLLLVVSSTSKKLNLQHSICLSNSQTRGCLFFNHDSFRVGRCFYAKETQTNYLRKFKLLCRKKRVRNICI